ncbi:hypothetical protein OF83DRAFT_1177164 [Amylostereum chailletii]|nr:hypothetical protein OF83DRAFT_1177164 [Amylostereum chailletii]
MFASWPHGALLALALVGGSVRAIGQQSCVLFTSSSSAFPIVSRRTATAIHISDDEWPGVQLAARDFASDIHNVTGVSPVLSNFSTPTTSKHNASTKAIIVGTLGKSSLIAQVVNNTQLDVSAIEGKWESFVTRVVSNPLPGVDEAYVIVGADKRGTIFALYDHSEQFGVSPWYWWADVPVTTHPELFVAPEGCSHGSPTVKYRGIFLNDEQPALTNWALEKFTNGTGAPLTGSPFNHTFYSKLFELLLLLKANFLWPAQWSSAFGIDDALNQFTADMYGVVMGTSHEEPMMRSIPVEWDLFGQGPWDYSTNADFIYNFWVQGVNRSKTFESMYTVGMRGNGDLPLSDGTNIALLEKIVSDQRTILTDEINGTNVDQVPQAWCLYKEVQGYYEEGMTVPEDITLLWTDDNWGNIRRYPIPSERNRTGGAGVYYHFDYVGDPRDYKWIQSTQLSKVYEQMSLAVDRQANQIWIVNVGDLKPLEMPIEFFVSYGWNATRWNLKNLDDWTRIWAQREFDLGAEDADAVVGVVGNMTRYLARRKPELLNSTIFSLVHYREADNILADWAAVNETSSRIYESLPATTRPAFFQLVHHPVQAGFTLTKMWVAAGINNMRATQARLSANDYAVQVEELFDEDYNLELQYHTLLDGKWDHIMDQTHVLYNYWQQPTQNMMPSVSRVSSRKKNIAGAIRVVPEGSLGVWPGDNVNNCAAGYSCPPPTVTLDFYAPTNGRFVDIDLGGPTPADFAISTNVTWLKFSTAQGSLTPSRPDTRVAFSVDWDRVRGAQAAQINIDATAEGFPALSVPVYFVANHTAAPADFKGFVEGDGGISIEAAHAARNTTVGEVAWTEIPNYGRTLSGVTPWPRLGNNEANYTAGSGPSIEYDFYNFNTIGQAGNVSVNVMVSPSLNANGNDRPIAVAVQVDDGQPARTTYFIPSAAPGSEPPQWSDFVANGVVEVVGNFTALPGAHTLKVWMVEPAVVVQKIVIDTGGVRRSYLDPPESVLLA